MRPPLAGMTGPFCQQTMVVDLTAGAAEAVAHPDLLGALVGGRGYGVGLVASYGSPELGPLDPRQPLVISAGPLTGTAAPSSGRFAAVGVSPLTGTIFDGNAGGRFGVRLRQAGVDALVLLGRAQEWSVLVVEGRGREGSEPEIRLESLQALWPGVKPMAAELTSGRTVSGLRRALGPGFSLVFPSVAGRRGALLGSLRTDDHRNFGRGGFGAVMAAKNLFAVAVAGEGSPAVADQELFEFVVYEAGKQLSANPVTSRALPQFGTAVLVHLVNMAGAFPVRNFLGAGWGQAEALSGEVVRESLAAGRKGCFGCRLRCTPRVGQGEGPEYETLWALGADCGVSDLGLVQAANRWCGELGLDTISTGATIACAMEMGELGLIGRRLRFGDGDRLLELVREMGEGHGFGAELADGSARFAARYDRPELAMHVKGLELPAYDPRAMQGQGLAYATSNRGACHLRGNMLGPEILGIPKLIDRFATRGKSGILINLQHLAAAFDSACLCKFAGFAFGEEVLARLLTAVRGVPLSPQDLLLSGERVWNLERLWNLAAGFSRADDTLPQRLLTDPLADGPAAGHVVDLEPMLDEYYRARGWDGLGRPSARKIDQLGLASLLGPQADRLVQGPPAHRKPTAGPGQGWRAGLARSTSGDLRRSPADAPDADAGPEGPPVVQTPRGKDGRHLRSV
jgi:aldehyde:ferredoxin oxidoreductase